MRSHNVFVTNIDHTATQEDVAGLFSRLGIPINGMTLKSEGNARFAFVRVPSSLDFEQVVATVHGQTLCGRVVRTGFTERRSRGGARIPRNAPQSQSGSYDPLGPRRRPLGGSKKYGDVYWSGQPIPSTEERPFQYLWQHGGPPQPTEPSLFSGVSGNSSQHAPHNHLAAAATTTSQASRMSAWVEAPVFVPAGEAPGQGQGQEENKREKKGWWEEDGEDPYNDPAHGYVCTGYWENK